MIQNIRKSDSLIDGGPLCGLIYPGNSSAIAMNQKTASERRVNEESLDLIRCKMNNSSDLGLDEEQVEMSIEEYRRFLILKMENPGVKLSPTGLMDKAWHTHILDTRRYAEDCEAMFGRFLHHHPSYKGAESGQRGDVLTRASEVMSSLYSEMYGHDPLGEDGGCNTDDDGSACTGVSCCDG